MWILRVTEARKESSESKRLRRPEISRATGTFWLRADLIGFKVDILFELLPLIVFNAIRAALWGRFSSSLLDWC